MLFNKFTFLENKLKKWVNNELISEEQVRNIIQFEKNNAPLFKFKALTLIAMLGGLFIALGIIFIISSNWDNIPHFYKIIGFLSLLIACCELSVYFLKKTNTILTNALEIIWFLLPLAGIGLYGQIYQLSGDSFKPMIIWLLLTLPMVYVTKNRQLILLHTLGLIVSIFVGTFEKSSIISLGYLNNTSYYRHSIWRGAVLDFFRNYFGAVCIVCILWTNIFWQIKKFCNPKFLKISLFSLIFYLWLLGVVSYSSIFSSYSIESLFLLASVLLIFYVSLNPFLSCKKDDETFYVSNYIFIGVIFYAFTFLWNSDSARNAHKDIEKIQFFYFYYRMFILCAGILMLYFSNKITLFSKNLNGKIFYCLLFLPLVLTLMYWLKVDSKFIAALANILFVLVCFKMMYDGVVESNYKLINLGVFSIGLIMLTRFIDYFGTLLTSGIAFIVLGMVFIIAAYFMNKGRKFLIEKIEKK